MGEEKRQAERCVGRLVCFVEKDAKGFEDATRFGSVHGHAEPVGDFLFGHGLDTLETLAHEIAVAHGGEYTEDKAEKEGGVFGERKGGALLGGEVIGFDAVDAPDLAELWIKIAEGASRESSDADRFGEVGGERRRKLPDLHALFEGGHLPDAEFKEDLGGSDLRVVSAGGGFAWRL